MPKTDPTERPHPTPRIWECSHCHAAIGRIVRDQGTDVLYYRAYLFPNHFYDKKVDHRATLPCAFCGEFTEWYMPLVHRYDSKSIERAIAELDAEIKAMPSESKTNEAPHA